MKSQNIKYFPALDHLRFLAVCMVMLFHGAFLVFGDFMRGGVWTRTWNPLYAFVMEGHSAVVLFMVLSGFIFTVGASGRHLDYFKFLRNRFLRIYPMYLAVVAAGLYFFPEAFSIIPLLKNIFFMGNQDGALNLGPFSAVFWSISVELQFYLVFPFLLLLFNKYGVKALVSAVLLVFAARFALAFMGANIRYMTYLTLLGRIDQFIIGMIASQVYLGAAPEKLRKLLLPSVLAALTMLVTTNQLGGFQDAGWWRLYWPPVEASAWAFFMICYVARVNENSNIIHSALSRFGEVSYSFYLTHYIIWAAIPAAWFIRVGTDPVVNSVVNSLLIALPVTLALSFVTYNLIEKPFLSLRGKYL